MIGLEHHMREEECEAKMAEKVARLILSLSKVKKKR